jgi:hypothetical protein
MIAQSSFLQRKVVLVELNEITWRLLDPLLERGELPNIAALIRRGARGTTIAPEVPPDLDPWISWTTLYTGRPPQEHGVKFLEQPPETVHGPRIWDMAAEAGRSVGVFGSIMSWPPRTDVRGYWVPGTFSPDTATFPAELEPIQELNLTYTRAFTPLGGQGARSGKLGLVWKLRKLGLRAATLAKIAGFFARRMAGRARDWEKVSLQPLVNYDFFAALWSKHRPDLATFHSNHIAHYQHRYWRSTDPLPFLEKPSREEVEQYGGSIRLGYQVADELLGRMRELVGPDTVIVIASGLGQQPYVTEEFRDGRTIVRMKDIDQVLELLGVRGECDRYSVMAPQWNVRFASEEAQQRAIRGLDTAYYQTPDQPLLKYVMAGNTICLNISQKLRRPLDWDADCVFPESRRRVKLRDLCAEKDPTPKQGYHDPAGVLIVAGQGIQPAVDFGECSTLDVAPTILRLMGLDVPDHMRGRVLEEILVQSGEPAPLPHRATARGEVSPLAGAR